jgi:hypothetical protein
MAKSVSNLTEAELVAELTKVESAMDATRKAMEPLNAKWKREYELKDRIQKALAEIKKNDMAYVMANASAHSQWQKMMPRQAYGSGVWQESGEQAWKLKINYKEAIDQDLIDFIEKWSKLTKENKIEIFRHDLCEYGHWVVELKDSKWIIYDERSFEYKYHGQKPEATFDLLLDMLNYVAEHHWYSGGQSNNDDDDDEY